MSNVHCSDGRKEELLPCKDFIQPTEDSLLRTTQHKVYRAEEMTQRTVRDDSTRRDDSTTNRTEQRDNTQPVQSRKIQSSQRHKSPPSPAEKTIRL